MAVGLRNNKRFVNIKQESLIVVVMRYPHTPRPHEDRISYSHSRHREEQRQDVCIEKLGPPLRRGDLPFPI